MTFSKFDFLTIKSLSTFDEKKVDRMLPLTNALRANVNGNLKIHLR